MTSEAFSSICLSEEKVVLGRPNIEALMRSLMVGAVFFIPTVFILVPFCLFLVASFGHVDGATIRLGFELTNYERIFQEPTTRSVVLRTLALGLSVSVICTGLGYPVAYLMTISSRGIRNLLMTAFATPLLMSYVIKIYAIRNLLGARGVINNFLISSGLTDGPLDLFSLNYYGIFLTLTSILLPFAVFPIVLALDRIPRSLVEAAADLGSGRLRIFRSIIFPLSLPGVAVALSFTFVIAIGDFITPELVGGTSGFTLGRIIYSQFGLAFNWPFGAALSVFMMIIVTIALAVASFIRPAGKVTF